MIRRSTRSTQSRSSAASDVYKRQRQTGRNHAAVCINKVDQAGIGQGLLGTEDALDTGNGDEALARAREAVLRAKSSFEERGVAVFLASAALTLGVEELQALLKGKTSVFAGPLGVGKTSLLKRIWPGLEAKTFVISNVTGKSRHSTTFSSLIELSLIHISE